MRVGIFTNAYRPLVSGVVNSIDLIRKGLLRRGHKVFLFAPEYRGYREEHSGVWRFRSLSLTRRVDFPLPIPFSTRIFRLIPRLRLDVIHTHHPFLLGNVGVYFARKLGLPVVYTFHTQLEQYAHYVPLHQDFVRFMARNSVADYMRKVDRVICPSPSVRALLDEYGVERPVHVLENAVDTSAFRNAEGEALRRRLGIAPGRVVCLYAGRLGREKNLAFLLRAFSAVHRKDPRAMLMLVGDGPERESLQALARELGLAEQVLFAGRIDYRRIPQYYAAADLFVMTSVTEVKPLAILEAMASGLPVVAVAASGSQDTVTHGRDGLLSSCCEEEYARVLSRAVGDEALRRRLGARAPATAQRYSIDAYIDRLLEIYRAAGSGR